MNGSFRPVADAQLLDSKSGKRLISVFRWRTRDCPLLKKTDAHEATGADTLLDATNSGFGSSLVCPEYVQTVVHFSPVCARAGLERPGLFGTFSSASHSRFA